MRDWIAHVYDEDGILFGSYVLERRPDEPAALQRQALSLAIEDGLNAGAAERCRVHLEKCEEQV